MKKSIFLLYFIKNIMYASAFTKISLILIKGIEKESKKV